MSRTFTIRIRARWLTYALVAALTAAVVAPVAVWAADKFTDVPDTHTFHDDISWLADAGITKGCNPPDNTLYCPEDNVTRGQMAAFMKRFAGYIGAEDGTPAQADNADTLDGVDSTGFVGTPAALDVAAAGFVASDGTIWSGTGNFSVVYDAANTRYKITITGVNYYYLDYVTVVTPVTSGYCRTGSVSGDLLVYCFDTAGNPTVAHFQFVTYDPTP